MMGILRKLSTLTFTCLYSHICTKTQTKYCYEVKTGEIYRPSERKINKSERAKQFLCCFFRQIHRHFRRWYDKGQHGLKRKYQEIRFVLLALQLTPIIMYNFVCEARLREPITVLLWKVSYSVVSRTSHNRMISSTRVRIHNNSVFILQMNNTSYVYI